MDIRKKEAKLKLAGQIFNKEYKTPRLIIQGWLKDNPFNPEELNAKGNPLKFPTSHQDWYIRLTQILEHAEAGTLDKLYDGKNSIITTYKGKQYKTKIFSFGNDKLKFLNWSTMPSTTCKGAGACLSFCYSLNSLRMGGAFVRWVCNMILEDDKYLHVIKSAFEYSITKKKICTDEFKKDGRITFRLYNDGDFPNKRIIKFWMDLIKDNPSVNAYGYSKSLQDLYLYQKENPIPKNYVLNISDGANMINTLYKELLLKCDFVRGEFRGIKSHLGKISPTKLNRKQIKELSNQAKEEFKLKKSAKVFVCRGLCNSCSSAGHVCGSKKFNDFVVITPIH